MPPCACPPTGWETCQSRVSPRVAGALLPRTHLGVAGEVEEGRLPLIACVQVHSVALFSSLLISVHASGNGEHGPWGADGWEGDLLGSMWPVGLAGEGPQRACRVLGPKITPGVQAPILC